jgi:tRNA(Ile)-lysidine synthase
MSEIDESSGLELRSLTAISKVEQALHQLPKTDHIIVAFSGGMDSSVLLHMLVRLGFTRQANVDVVHVHHGVSVHADEWVEHCCKQAKSLALECVVEYADIDSAAGSFEEQARKARYSIFENYMSDDSLLLTAHHADDQIETVLMRAMRQGDVSLSAGIPQQRAFSGGCIYRPFLSLSRKDLHECARALGLTWVEDESNQDIKIERNRLRHSVLPRLRERDALIDAALMQVSQGHARINASREGMFSKLFPKISSQCFSNADAFSVMDVGIDLQHLARLSFEAQRLCIRDWMKARDLPQPNKAIFERIWSELISARPDADPIVQWGRVCMRRWRGSVYLIDASQIVSVSISSGLHDGAQLGGRWLVSDVRPTCQDRVSLVSAAAGNAEEAGHASLRLESYANLHREIRVFGKSKRRWLKDRSVPPWRRDALLCLVDETHKNVVQVIDLQSLATLASRTADESAASESWWLCRS